MIRSILQYTMQLAMEVMDDRMFSRLAMTTVATNWQQLFPTATQATKILMAYDLVHAYQCLNEALPVATVIKELITSDGSSSSSSTADTDALHLTALQIVFDLTDTGDQAFCQRVADALTTHRPIPSTNIHHETVAEDVDGTASTVPTDTATLAVPDIWDNIFRVLVGGFVAELALSFRHKHSGADHAIMESLKRIMEDRSSGANRSSILHTNAIVTHAYLYAGTTYDAFLRNHLDWMKKASHWYVWLHLSLEKMSYLFFYWVVHC
jgi:hypothetical protein